MIDEGEVDWKLIAISKDDPKFNFYQSLANVEPDVMKSIINWFQFYKTTDGKPENKFEYDGNAMDIVFTNEVIMNAHHHWKKLIQKK